MVQTMQDAGQILIRGALGWRQGERDVLIENGHIAAVGMGLEAPHAKAIDGAGHVLLPGLVDAHTHLDKTLWGMGWHPNTAGPALIDKIDNERRVRREMGIPPDRQSARQVVQSVKMGTTHIRTHVDVDTECGLAGIHGLMATREQLNDMCDIEIVAFPQSGMLVRPGTRELLEEAMKLGSDVVGGLDPCAIDRDPAQHLDIVFALAERFGKPVDIHLHESAELGAFSMELIIERTKAHAMQGAVTVSHAFCLGMTDRAYAKTLIDALAREKIAVMTHGAPSRPVPPIAECYEAGVVVCCGQDGIRDSWGPYGNGDMLERAMIIGMRNNFRRDDEVEMALDVCTFGGAKVMNLPRYGLKPGDVADLVLVKAEAPAEAVVARPQPRTVIKRGRIVARDGDLTKDYGIA